MDYNTQREKLRLSEYGRNVQSMVDYAMTISDRGERLNCAKVIIGVMSRMYPQNKQNANFDQMLWDHLAYMSNYQLDIDWPYEITKVSEVGRPERMPYPMNNIQFRHYGHLVEQLVQKVKDMEEGPEREHLINMLANQMRKDLYYSSKNALDPKRIADNLYYMSDGKINIEEGQVRYNSSIPTSNTAKSRRVKRNK